MSSDQNRTLTSGEHAVGLNFNPSNHPLVDEIKSAMAHVFDLVEQSVPADDGTLTTARKRKMRDAALDHIITAQMWAVKVVTSSIADATRDDSQDISAESPERVAGKDENDTTE